IKKMLGAAALAICCIMPFPLTVSAAENNEIKLEANGSEASLELYFPQAAAEEIASMQVSVSVRASSDSVNLEFIPDSSLAAKIVESRYQSNTGTLNIYLAGTESLFSSSEFTKVGRVKINTSGNNAASAAVEVIKDSVKFVRSGELVSPDNDTDYPASVTITALGQSSSGTSNPSYPNYPSGNYFPNIPVLPSDNNNRYDNDDTRSPVWNDSDADPDADIIGDQYNNAVLEEQDTIGENLNPPDTSALLDALSRADDYKATDYTESSYADLREAVDNANELISDPNAAQDEIDEALLNIENAIGMLKLRNDIPSGAEGYGENNDTGAYGGVNSNTGDREYGQGEQSSDGYDADQGSNGNGVQTSQDGNIVNASDDARPVYNADDPFSGNEDSGRIFPLWIIVIAAIAVAAATAAVIILKKANKKKDAEGNHFKD
ncbi:MAG: FIVAR domain-containing protein, partial [Oscillospiraceae bacterium]|nr:FIVAR domain-containing protein [Oscillospiraceae bacterium]